MPIRVVLFSSASDYNRFRWSNSGNKPGYYLPGRKHDYIVLHNARSRVPLAVSQATAIAPMLILRSRKQTLFHEYAHLVQHQATPYRPLWLEEGLAELYSVIELSGNTFRLGSPIAAHRATLRNEALLGSDMFVTIDDRSQSYRGRRANTFYAQSWGFVHMLSVSEQYQEGFPPFLTYLDQGHDQEEAFQTAFGHPLSEALEQLVPYLRRNRLPSRSRPSGRPSASAEPEVKKLTALEVALLELDLLLELGHTANAEEVLSRVERKHPGEAAVAVRAGELHLRLLDYDEARSSFDTALSLGAGTARGHSGQAQSLDETDGARRDVWRHLEIALKLNPSLPEALLLAGMLYNRERKYQEAAETFRKLTQSRPRWSGVWRSLAFAELSRDQPEDAHRFAQLALLTAQTDFQRQEARRMIRQVQAAGDQ